MYYTIYIVIDTLTQCIDAKKLTKVKLKVLFCAEFILVFVEWQNEPQEDSMSNSILCHEKTSANHGIASQTDDHR
jgi:hypothetical protein